MIELVMLSLRPIGWSMVHSLWEGTFIVAIAAAMLGALRKRSAGVRCTVAYVALLAMVVLPIMTADWQLPGEDRGSSATGVAGKMLSSTTQSSWAPTIVVDRGFFEAAAAIVEPALPWIAALWLLGFLVSLSRLSFGWFRVRSLVRKGELCTDTLWITTVTRLRGRLDLRRLITLLESSSIEVPTVVGWLRPVILVPASTLTGLSPRQLETILAHEMAHIHRNDYLFNLIQSIAETLLFFHPAAWWLSKVIREERENACDDIAVSICGDAMLHAKALAALETLRTLRLSPAVAANGGSLISRVRRLVTSPANDNAPSLLGLGALAAVLALTVTFAPRLDGAAKMPEFDLDAFGEGWSSLSGTPASTTFEVVASRLDAEPAANPVRQNVRTNERRNLNADEACELEPETHRAESTPERAGKHRDGDRRAGGGRRTIDDLIGMKVLGVDPQLIASWKQHGYGDLTIDEASAIAALGIDVRYAREMSDLFHRRLEVEELSGLKAMNVSRSYVQSLRSKVPSADVDAILAARATGVTPELIDELRRQGLGIDDLEEISGLRAAGVTADYIRDMRAAGIDAKHPDDLAAMRATGVTPEYVREMRRAGIDVHDEEQLAGLRALGVDAAWIDEIAAAGLKDLDAEELMSLRALGIDGEWIARLRGAGLRDFDADDLKRLRISGIDGKALGKPRKRQSQH